jgi:tetratricopeptide (TPR) repeat protein
MRIGMFSRVRLTVIVAGSCLVWLTGCETTSLKMPDIFSANDSDKSETTGSINSVVASAAAPDAPAPDAGAPDPKKTADGDTTGTIASTGPDLAVGSGERAALLGHDPNDNLNLGKRHFRAKDYGLAERYFRRAVELSPRDSEAWLGLAASYDRLRRFDLADRAYGELLKLLGPTPEVLNNQGYSYMLRGDYRRARQILLQAQSKDPGNPYVRNNLDLLARSQISHKGIE